MRKLITALCVAATLCSCIPAFAQTTTQYRSSNPIVQPALWIAVTPSDSTDLPQGVAKGLYIDQAGTLAFIPADNLNSQAVTINAPAFSRIDGFIRRVLSTGTTATGIYSLY